MKLFRKVIDERQELEMMRVERSTFWLMFFLLMISIPIQLFVKDFGLEHVAGEFIISMVGCIWSLIGYARRGSWGYFTKPGIKSYIFYSLTAAFIVGIMHPLIRFFRNGLSILDGLLTFAINFAIMFPVCFLLMWFLGSLIKKRQNRLQQEYEDNE